MTGSWANSWCSLNAHGGHQPVPPLQGGAPAASPLEPGQQARAVLQLPGQPDRGQVTLRAAPHPTLGGPGAPASLGHPQGLGGTLESSRVTTRPTSSLHSGVLGLCASRSLENLRGTTWNWSEKRQRRASWSVLGSGALPPTGGHPPGLLRTAHGQTPCPLLENKSPPCAGSYPRQGPPHRPAPGSDRGSADGNDGEEHTGARQGGREGGPGTCTVSSALSLSRTCTPQEAGLPSLGSRDFTGLVPPPE